MKNAGKVGSDEQVIGLLILLFFEVAAFFNVVHFVGPPMRPLGHRL